MAASNHDDPAVIRGMVDRSRRLASPFGGPAFLRRYYKRVQLASPIWMVARVEPASPGFEAWSAIFPKPADLVISASYNPLHLPLRAGVLHLRAEASAGSDEDARNITDKANVFLTMFRSAEVSVGSAGTDADVKAFFDSLRVRQEEQPGSAFGDPARRCLPQTGGVFGPDAGARTGSSPGHDRQITLRAARSPRNLCN